MRQNFSAKKLAFIKVRISRKDKRSDTHFLVILNLTQNLIHTTNQSGTAT